jgi:hypothetical protein
MRGRRCVFSYEWLFSADVPVSMAEAVSVELSPHGIVPPTGDAHHG